MRVCAEDVCLCRVSGLPLTLPFSPCAEQRSSEDNGYQTDVPVFTNGGESAAVQVLLIWKLYY